MKMKSKIDILITVAIILHRSTWLMSLQHNHQYQQQQQRSSMISLSKPSISIEGCVDNGCFLTLNKHYDLISKCLRPLQESPSHDENDYHLRFCCNLIEFERCLFPYIITLCGFDSLDHFEKEMHSINYFCSMSTLQFSKCEKAATNETESIGNDEELRN